jgi:hypothetical protein
MREYGKVSASFWIGKTGKALRGNPEAQIVAMYLMTCPTSEMTGVFHCPIMYIAHETGLGFEGASKGLKRLAEIDFCTYDDDSDSVFVHEMAKYQIGEELKVSDNQVKFVKKAFLAMSDVFKAAFYERYKSAFHLEFASPSEAPSKPRAGASTGTEAGTGADIAPSAKSKKAKTALPAGFAVSERVHAWAAEKGYTNLQAHLENFISAAKRNGYVYVDWDEALMEAIRKDWAKLSVSAVKSVVNDLAAINARNNAEAKRLLGIDDDDELRVING